MASGTGHQTFHTNQFPEHMSIPTRWDPDTGQDVIYWEDVQRIFGTVSAVLSNGEPVPFLVNDNLEVLLPWRISLPRQYTRSGE